jgi:lauroyl/myristoyl acyltransferase
VAFYQAGYAVSHLSRPEHGFSATPYGVRVLNPLWTKIEDRFIAERTILGSKSGGLELLKRRLSGNRIVSITVGNQARRTLDVPFFKGEIRLATGPAYLSQTCQAPLVPVFTFRVDTGDYMVSIGPAVDNQRSSQDNYIHVISAYVAMLEQCVLSYPDQWNGWIRSVKRQRSELEQRS